MCKDYVPLYRLKLGHQKALLKRTQYRFLENLKVVTSIGLSPFFICLSLSPPLLPAPPPVPVPVLALV